jgi:hypothetical protein
MNDQTFGPWRIAGNAVLAAVRDWPDPLEVVKASELAALVTIAVEPRALSHPGAKETRRLFHAVYERTPDLTLSILTAARESWSDQSVTARVRKVMAMNPVITTGSKTSEYVWKAKASELAIRVVKAKRGDKTAATVKRTRTRILREEPPPALFITRTLADELQRLAKDGLKVWA